jgi:diguanylate cyclase (GGDEF)-like protein
VLALALQVAVRAQDLGGGLPGAPSILLNPRRAAAFGAAIVSGLLLLQYAHRRRPFILLWAAGWLLIAPAMLLVARPYAGAAAARAAVGLSQFLGICSGVMFLWSADLFRHTGYVRPRRLWVLVAVAAWFLLSPLVLGPAMVLVPGYLASAVVLAGAASMYVAVVLERRLIGAGLVAFVLLGLAISNVATAFAAGGLPPTSRYSLGILTIDIVLYAFGALGMHLLVFEDMTYELRTANRRLEAAREELVSAAITDPLTGCHNRRFLEQVTDRELQRHARFKLPMSLLFIDIDRFKAVNDALGHETGDLVLQYVARFLMRNVREADYVFRYGGDEFLVLITCAGDEARRKAVALKAAFDAAPDAVDLPPGIGLSVGCIEVPQGTTDLTALIHEADKRMYEDKAGSGRDARGERRARSRR